MSAIASRPDFVSCRTIPAQSRCVAGSERVGVFRRLYAGVMRSRQHRAEQDVARLLGQSGGRLTDDIERRMTEQLLGNHGFRP